jgi:hypothetical protein
MAGRDMPPTRRGYSPFEVVSAWQKAVRRSDPDASTYWALELVISGHGAWWWKRARIVAVEDIGPAGGPGLVSDIGRLNDQWAAAKGAQDGHDLLYVVHAAIALAMAPKSRLVDWALWHHRGDHTERREIPDEALDRHTRRGRAMGRDYAHFLDEASRLEPWTGDLAELETEYRDHAVRAVENDPSRPRNPWTGGANVGTTTKPAHNSPHGDSGQLSMPDQEQP